MNIETAVSSIRDAISSMASTMTADNVFIVFAICFVIIVAMVAILADIVVFEVTDIVNTIRVAMDDKKHNQHDDSVDNM